ncbi:MAG: hypothetical protein JXB38_08835 [Anaerolineales bacterium]|nr:hypothetical protein [Anaerolineales bacterium]
MKRRKNLRIGSWIASLMLLGLACRLMGGNDAAPAPVDSENNIPEGIPGVFTEWPEDIPDDIPEFDAQIRLVMEGDTHTRIFYENISKKQLEEYLQTLEDAGFSLEYKVYVAEGHPDNSAERVKKGEYDAVYITKGDYELRIEWGEDTTVLDIYASP